ncbi:MAG: HAD-IA family hydrolase [Micrococcales bacterium]|nr:HAD-IA family hydrolase [Micrococcales bacterium]
MSSHDDAPEHRHAAADATPGPIAVLFDADGLLQHPKAGWVERLNAYDPGDGTGFLTALWEAEVPALRGQETLRQGLQRLLRERDLDDGRVDELHALWDNIEIDPGAWQVVRDVRAAGTPTYLATNQQEYRKQLMLDLGYADLVDVAFFSCDLGAAKPEPAYFERILQRLGIGSSEAPRVVFLDDMPANVDSAASVGITALHHDPNTGAANLRALLRTVGVPGA